MYTYIHRAAFMTEPGEPRQLNRGLFQPSGLQSYGTTTTSIIYTCKTGFDKGKRSTATSAQDMFTVGFLGTAQEEVTSCDGRLAIISRLRNKRLDLLMCK